MDFQQIESIKRRYRENASWYDAFMTRLSKDLRPLAITRLALKPGETVLDLGCGSGLSFELLERGVGPQGRIIGVELSPDMLALSREKIERHQWNNITLIESTAEDVDIPGFVDAVLCFFTPQIMSSPIALERALTVLRPGGRLVASGMKRPEGVRGIPVNLFYMMRFRVWHFVNVKEIANRLWGTEQPYAILERMIKPLERRDYLGGCTYIAYAIKEANASSGS